MKKRTSAASVVTMYQILRRHQIGTNHVEQIARKLRLNGRRMGLSRNVKMVNQLIDLKVSDAKEEQWVCVSKFRRAKRLLYQNIGARSNQATLFQTLLRNTLQKQWQEQKAKNTGKVAHLRRKYGKTLPNQVEGISVSDQELERIRKPISAPHIWGPPDSLPQLSEAAIKVLQLPPKTTVFPKVDLMEVEMEVGEDDGQTKVGGRGQMPEDQ